jgi:hypothetical protein
LNHGTSIQPIFFTPIRAAAHVISATSQRRASSASDCRHVAGSWIDWPANTSGCPASPAARDVGPVLATARG